MWRSPNRDWPQYSGVSASSAARCMAPESRNPCNAARNFWRSLRLGGAPPRGGDRLCGGRGFAGDGAGDPSGLLSCCAADAALEAEDEGGAWSTEPPPSSSLQRCERKKKKCVRGNCHQFMAASTLPPVAARAWAACSAENPALVSSCVSWLWLFSIRSLRAATSTTIGDSKTIKLQKESAAI